METLWVPLVEHSINGQLQHHRVKLVDQTGRLPLQQKQLYQLQICHQCSSSQLDSDQPSHSHNQWHSLSWYVQY